MTDQDPESADRKRPARGVLITDSDRTTVFVSLCTKDRRRWLASAAVHDGLRQAWDEAQAWWLGRYVVIMPDHIHLFAAPTHMPVELDAWIQFWKSAFTKHMRRSGSFDIPAHPWQTGHWDTRLRTWQNYDQKWDYVRNNPVRHGLVARSGEWPYQGEMHSLTWD